MDKNAEDQEWGKIQAHIEQLFGRYFRNSLDPIEDKTRNALSLLSKSQDNRRDDPEIL